MLLGHWLVLGESLSVGAVRVDASEWCSGSVRATTVCMAGEGAILLADWEKRGIGSQCKGEGPKGPFLFGKSGISLAWWNQRNAVESARNEGHLFNVGHPAPRDTAHTKGAFRPLLFCLF